MIVAAVQARMGSTRLPKKVLADIGGRPMLWHIVQRLRSCRRVDEVVIATADNDSNAPIRQFAQEHEISCFAGSESDLIDRLYSLACQWRADALVRITADCPLVDPAVVDTLIETFMSNPGMEYVSNVHPQTYPHGLEAEVYSAAVLKRLWNEVTDPFWREWFPAYLTDHVDFFRTMNVTHATDLTYNRWTVDYEEDLHFVREAFNALHGDGEIFGMNDVLALLESQPQLREINGHRAVNTRETGIRLAWESHSTSKAAPAGEC